MMNPEDWRDEDPAKLRVNPEDLLRSNIPAVRWQAMMEEAVATYRERIHVLSRMSIVQDREAAQLHATVANAAATLALAMAVANAENDLELALSNLVRALEKS